jgi:hypothetical protein
MLPRLDSYIVVMINGAFEAFGQFSKLVDKALVEMWVDHVKCTMKSEVGLLGTLKTIRLRFLFWCTIQTLKGI